MVSKAKQNKMNDQIEINVIFYVFEMIQLYHLIEYHNEMVLNINN